jgi:sulfoxide reductase heme-binding subunit YedZ
MQRPTARTLVKPLVFILCALPFAWLVVGVTTDDLGPNPVDTITYLTGEWGLRILLATLCITPLQKLSGYRGLLRFRRMLGLYAFFYVALHLFTYLLLDAEFDLAWIIEDIRDRLYITAGFSGFCLMVPLALTSTQGMIKRLGAKRWQRLHSLIYISALAGVLHFLWLVKADTREPLVYAGVFLVLMALRIPKITQRLAHKNKSTQLPASSAKAA